MLDQLTIADFQALPDRRIEVVFGERQAMLEITHVRELGANTLRKTPAFALSLRESGATTSAPQGNYLYRHPQHGPIEMFTVPSGPDGLGMCYEITFN